MNDQHYVRSNYRHFNVGCDDSQLWLAIYLVALYNNGGWDL